MVIFMENKETFNYTYSAKEQKEIQEIRKKYEITEEKEDKMATLRRMDEEVTQKATVVSLVFGVVGTLIMGMGMSLAMTDIGAALGFSGWLSMIVGIFIGVVGRVIGAIRTCFLQSAFLSSCVKILANPTRIGCVFALADQKSDCRKSST